MNQESFAYPTIDLLQGKQKHQIDDKKNKNVIQLAYVLISTQEM